MKKVFILLVALSLGWGLKAQCPLQTAVDFTATDVHGEQVHLFDILDRGQYVLVDFFFTTCGPCQQATPKIVQSYYTMGCNQHDVFYIEIATGDSEAACLNWVNRFGVEYPTISGAAGGTSICNQYGISSYPTIILIAPDRSIVIRDLWPINNAQTVVSALTAQGVMPHDCNDPVGELTITPDTLWFSNMGEEQTFTILNETDATVTIEDVIPVEDSYLNIWNNTFPYSLEAGQSLEVTVTLQMPPMPPAKDEHTPFLITVSTSLGDKEVVAMVSNPALDQGLIIPGSPYVALDTISPMQELSVVNGNLGTQEPIVIHAVEEVTEGDPYLNIELTTELPFTLNAGEAFHFIISPLPTGERSLANTIVQVHYEGGTASFFIAIDGELLSVTQLNNTLSIYPNPANESLWLKGENLGKVCIYNVLGQKVDELTAHSTDLQINTTSYQNGVYFIKVNDKTMRFMVTH